jgi:hypothetical protein
MEDDQDRVVAQMPLALDLLFVLLGVRQHRAHMEHDLMAAPAVS